MRLGRHRTVVEVRVDPTPEILVNEDQLRDIVSSAWDAVFQAEALTQTLFVRDGRLVRLQRQIRASGEAESVIEEETETSIYGRLARVADWYRATQSSPTPARPVLAVARDMLVNPHADLPRLDAVATCPMFTADGTLLATPGYYAEAGVYLDPDRMIHVPEVSGSPTGCEIQAARELILEELLGEFPFAAEADRAHAVAAAPQCPARPLIEGPTPLHLIEAPEPGSGKGLLADAISLIATGGCAQVCTLADDNDEVRRTLTAELSLGRPNILLDNLDSTVRRGMIHSSALSARLTARIWTDRKIRTSSMPRYPNNALWLATGNNPRFSMELARRCVRVRLDPGVARPWLRTGFRHPDLRSWVTEHRAELLHALLTFVAAWIAEGRPPGTQRLGSFEDWSAVIGGILEVAGVPGFLGNLDSLYADADVEGQAWTEFVVAWWEKFGSKQVRPRQLLVVCGQHDLMESVRGSGGPRSQQTRLGLALHRAHDRVFGRHRIVLVQDKGKHGKWYALQADLQVADEPVEDVGVDAGHPAPKSTAEMGTSEGAA